MYSAFATAGRKREWFLGVGGRTGGRVERVLIGGVCLLLLLWVNPAALSAGVMAEPYNTKRCGVPRGVTQLTYDDSDYRDVYNVVRLARAARRLDVGLGIFQLSEQTRRYERATGFSIGPELRRLGMYVGNHTHSHTQLTRLGYEGIRWQMMNGLNSAYLRPPYGSYDPRIQRIARRLDLRICMWTFNTKDYFGLSADAICRNVVRNAPKGAVVLMHLNQSAANASTLRCMVRGLRARDHRICRPYTATHPKEVTPVRLYRLPC